jgi:uncharacterized spore protein YtfJ
MSELATRVIEPIEELLERMNVGGVFGEPVQEGEVTIIPVAEVSVLVGYGFGYGEGGPGEEAGRAGEGAGGGSGARGKATPRGYIRITPEGVTFEPITNETVIPLAGIAMSAWSVFWVGKTIRAIANVFASHRK